MSYLVPPEPESSSNGLEDRFRELEFLTKLEDELHRDLSMSRVLDITLDWAMRRTAADAGLVARCTDEGLQVLKVSGYAYQYVEKLTRSPIPLSSGMLGQVAETGKPAYMAYTSQIGDNHLIYEKTRSHFTVPLQVRDEIIGVIHLESRHPAHFNQAMRRFIQHVAKRAALALRNAERFTRTYVSEQVKSDMIRLAAHDLRNPLNAINNATHLLNRLQSKMPDAANHYVQSIELAAHQIRSLLEELLILERLESGLRIEREPVNLLNALESAISRTRADADNKAQEFVTNLPDLPLIVRGEFVYYRQAMVNLINNAIKYTPHRGKVMVSMERRGKRAFFHVTDNGYGVAEDRQQRLFQRFYRAEEPGTEHIEGTGLGLSLVKTIIERSEGEVWFRSKQGEGSTFGFWLPLVEEDMAEAAAESTRRATEAALFNVPSKTEEAGQKRTFTRR